MKPLVLLLLIFQLMACGGSSGGGGGNGDVIEGAKVLDEHACLQGSWMSVSRNIKINNINYPVAVPKCPKYSW